MRKLIINADDFALTEGCNTGIIKAFARGVVSSATILATCDGLPRAAEMALAAKLPLGLHLCLTHGRPAAPPEKIPSLIDGHGLFKHVDVIHQNPPPAEEVETEWRAQLAKLRSLGINPDHLDSHHYVHEYLGSGVADVALRLARELGVPLRHTVAENKEHYRRNGVKTTDGFIGEFYGEQASVEQLLDILSRPWSGALELMCHPGEADDAIGDISSYSRGRQNELKILLSPPVGEAIRARGIELICFFDL